MKLYRGLPLVQRAAGHTEGVTRTLVWEHAPEYLAAISGYESLTMVRAVLSRLAPKA